MLLIVLTAMTTIIAVYTNANSSLQKQMNMEKEQAQEQISITNVGIDETQRIENITIRNSGTVEVIIRALYRKQNGLTTLLSDTVMLPIAQGNYKTLNIKNLGLIAESDSKFFVATQRGVKSMEINEIQINYHEYLEYTNSSALSIGPLLLTFDSLNWAPCNDNGTLLDDWT